MKHTIIYFTILFIFIQCNTSPKIVPSDNISEVSSGSIIHYQSFPSKFITPRNVDIWLPEDYDKSTKYSVLYMHDGQMLFDKTQTWNKQEWGVDENISSLLKNHAIKKTIVVGIWNIPELRYINYFPQKVYESLPKNVQETIQNEKKYKPQNYTGTDFINSDRYLKFIVEELKPFVDANYSTLKDPQNTFIAGSSMGGLISMYAICEYPNIFGGAACISTHWPGISPESDYKPIFSGFSTYLSKNIPSSSNHTFYFDYGTETLDAYYPQFAPSIDSLFYAKGYDKSNFTNLKFEGEDHTENAWNKRLHIPFQFILKP